MKMGLRDEKKKFEDAQFPSKQLRGQSVYFRGSEREKTNMSFCVV